MSKARPGNFFEDFVLGARLVHPTPRTIVEADQSLYIALTGSRDPLASAATAAHALGFRDRPIESLLVFNMAFGKTVPDISLNAVANLGYADMRFVEPVFSGDTIAVESEVIGLRESSNGRTGVVHVRSTASNQHGRPVLSWTRWVLVHRRTPSAGDGGGSVPTHPSAVDPADLVVPHYGPAPHRIVAFTGQRELWDDYEVGERIDGGAGMTVNDSDHSMATRLYQNTARVHFDGVRMAATPSGKRLVYGGHVMSLCRGLSYDGLENVLSILAVNGGLHVAPTFAGDTLTCTTVVLDKFETARPGIGALRLRLLGAKNLDGPADIVIPATPPDGGRTVHAPGIVLDLDYTVAMPKRSHPERPI